MPTPELLTFKASYEYRANGQRVRASDITYIAENEIEAARSFERFWDNRQREVPEWFGELLAVKIYQVTIRPIAEDGSYQNRNSLFNFEWKCDMGWTYDDRVNYLIAQKERRK